VAAHFEGQAPQWRQGWTAAWVAAFAAVAALILVLLALLIWRELRSPPIAEPVPLAERLQRNAELERQIATLEAAPLAACTTPALEGPTGAAPVPAERQPPAAAEGILANRDLAALLHAATAMVLSDQGSATGFFIAADLLVTNRHAVAGSGDAVYVTSKSMGRVHRGEVVAATPAGREGSADFALVRVEGAPARQLLGFSGQFEQLMPVVAAGYPGLNIVHDPGFRALLQGDITAAPELVLNRGEVQAVQRSPQGLQVIAHSGRVLQGNSGGPLVDECGRVVGINTYIAVDAANAGHVSYAISADELASFLAANGVTVALAEASCGG
jgi:S1-C subfamily serine protease